MRNRIWFVFRKRYVEVKPVEANNPDTEWLVQTVNAVESFQDDRNRYGFRIAVTNFLENIFWRFRIYGRNAHASSIQ